MRSVSAIAMAAILLVAPALVSAADMGNRDVLEFGEPKWTSDNEFTVPISVVHDENLVAMDIPLEWSKGVTLTSVSFDDTRVDYFDAKIANIDAENNKVVIGLISMVYGHKEALKPGNGTIAELNFRRDDVTLEQFEINPFICKSPGHKLSLVYNNLETGKPVVENVDPQLEGNTISLTKNPSGSAGVVPTTYSLGQNYPNPFNPATTIAFSVKTAGQVNLSIYNVLGQEVRSLVNEFKDAGNYSAYWDGRDNGGGEVASGVYFYRIKSGDFNDIKKMVLMK
jgi:hypothetical protein